MSGGINESAYNIQQAKIYASADNNGGHNEKIDFQEAQQQAGSIFQNGTSPLADKIEAKIKDSGKFADSELGQAKALVQKYLGNLSFSAMVQNKYSEIAYQAVNLKDEDNSSAAQTELDNAVNAQIKSQLEGISSSIDTEYAQALERALEQATNEMKGDADITSNGTVTGKTDDFNTKLNGLRYQRSADGKYQNIATYNGASGSAEVSQGYTNTVQFLEANGAKTFEREVNGQKQTIFVFKDQNGDKQRVVVDDAGQIHNLETTTTRGKNTYVTSDAKDEALSVIGEGATDIEIKRRKVDGQYQTVVRYTDANGNKQARVIDQNEVTGQTNVSDELTHVSAGGRAKYTSGTSGLSSYVNTQDGAEFKDGKVKTGTWTDSAGETHDDFKISQRGRGKLDAAGLQTAVDNIIEYAATKGGTSTDSENEATVSINGHTYTIDKTDFKKADRTMRLIRAELDAMPDAQHADPTQLNFNYNESDGRVDANGVEQNEASTTGHTGIQWGVDGNTHRSNNTTDVHSLRGHYNNNLSRAQFQSEGWASGTDRAKEKEYIAKMDQSADASRGIKHTRNLSTSTEFAQRFLEANFANKLEGLTDAQKDLAYRRLGAAIQTANPSLFDNSGHMYKNADFARLNLPSDVSRYTNPEEPVRRSPRQVRHRRQTPPTPPTPPTPQDNTPPSPPSGGYGGGSWGGGGHGGRWDTPTRPGGYGGGSWEGGGSGARWDTDTEVT